MYILKGFYKKIARIFVLCIANQRKQVPLFWLFFVHLAGEHFKAKWTFSSYYTAHVRNASNNKTDEFCDDMKSVFIHIVSIEIIFAQ